MTLIFVFFFLFLNIYKRHIAIKFVVKHSALLQYFKETRKTLNVNKFIIYLQDDQQHFNRDRTIDMSMMHPVRR